MSMKSKHMVNHLSTQVCKKTVAELISGLISLLFNVVSSKPFIIFMATSNPFYYVLFSKVLLEKGCSTTLWSCELENNTWTKANGGEWCPHYTGYPDLSKNAMHQAPSTNFAMPTDFRISSKMQLKVCGKSSLHLSLHKYSQQIYILVSLFENRSLVLICAWVSGFSTTENEHCLTLLNNHFLRDCT